MAAIALLATADSYPAGAPTNSATEGCSCHGPPSDTVHATLTGLPRSYAPGTRYNLSLTILGGPPTAPGRYQGGLAVAVTAGRLEAGPGTQVSDGLFLTHTLEGANQRSWTFSWTAPAPARAGDRGNTTFF